MRINLNLVASDAMDKEEVIALLTDLIEKANDHIVAVESASINGERAFDVNLGFCGMLDVGLGFCGMFGKEEE